MAIDATVGGAGANSYVDLAEAADYFDVEAHPLASQWSALDEAAQEAALRRATWMVDQLRFHGCRASSTQRLQFPRVYKRWCADTIPQTLKDAVCEQAIAIARNPERSGLSMRAQLQAEGVTQFTIGELSETFAEHATGSKRAAEDKLCDSSRTLLTRFIARMGRFT